MAKGIRERLLKQAIKFHQWQEATYPGKTSEELGGVVVKLFCNTCG